MAKQLGNVSQACKMMGYSRDSFYRFKQLYDTGGKVRCRNSRTSQTANLEEPHAARCGGDHELRPWRWTSQPSGKSVSPTNFANSAIRSRRPAFRGVWLRHDLENDEEAAQGARGQGRPRRAYPY